MSPTARLPIDSSFEAEPSQRVRQISGVKRKARHNAGHDATSGSSSRSTRRSLAVANSLHDDEPARGEEENLLGYDGTKRSKLNASAPYSTGHDGSSDDPTRPLNPTSVQPLLHPAIQSMGYPFGITPFRYPCLHPHAPAPPPGDPNDPRFRPFDPAASPPSSHPSSGQRSRASNSASVSADFQGTMDPSLAQYMSTGDYITNHTPDAAYDSLSALLAASQSSAYPISHPTGRSGPR